MASINGQTTAPASEMIRDDGKDTTVHSNDKQSEIPNQEVEMTQLPAQQSTTTTVEPDNRTTADASASLPTASNSDAVAQTQAASVAVQPPVLARSETAEFALGPDGAALPTQPTDSPEAVLRITLMLTTGARHPYAISSKYLTARKVQAVNEAGNFDPREMSAYKLKELIWTDWRPEWEPKPRDPAAIRLIILGRMLEDKSQLKGGFKSCRQKVGVILTICRITVLPDRAKCRPHDSEAGRPARR